jgi:hypothetical protein
VSFALVFLQDIRHSLLYAVVIITGYEFALTSFGLKEYIFYSPRVDLISANKEGIFSSFGYLALALIGMTFGRYVFLALHTPSPESLEEQYRREKKLLIKLVL